MLHNPIFNSTGIIFLPNFLHGYLVPAKNGLNSVALDEAYVVIRIFLIMILTNLDLKSEGFVLNFLHSFSVEKRKIQLMRDSIKLGGENQRRSITS